MDKEKILLPLDMGGNGLSGNGAEISGTNMLLSDNEFEKLSMELDKAIV